MEKKLKVFLNQNPSAGTSSLNKNVPIHRWYLVPMSFSYKLVETIIDLNSSIDMKIMDPFTGSATTLVCAKQKGLEAIGLENHKFMHLIANGKISWEHSPDVLESIFKETEQLARLNWTKFSIEHYPKFLKNCYTINYLKQLRAIWHYLQEKIEPGLEPLFMVLMSATLRKSLCALANLPYIQPIKKRKEPISPFVAFRNIYLIILEDLRGLNGNYGRVKAILGDARTMENLPYHEYDLIVTSPPYLNNIDYADHTRLELYFFGFANTWSEITEEIRSNLVTAATTQVHRKPTEFEEQLASSIPTPTGEKILKISLELKSIIKKRKNKKYYDRMVVNYFIEMDKHLQKSFQILKTGGAYYMTVGDSAPYGIHVKTDLLLASLAREHGFETSILKIRSRGGRFVTTQKHDKKLRESLVILRRES